VVCRGSSDDSVTLTRISTSRSRRIHSLSRVSNLSHITVGMISVVGDSLDTAVREIDRVGSSDNTVSISGLRSLEVGLGVIISDTVGVGVGLGDLLDNDGGGGVVGGGCVGNDGGSMSNYGGVDSMDSVDRGSNSVDSMDRGGVDNGSGVNKRSSVDSVSNGMSSYEAMSDMASMGDHSSMSVGDHVRGDGRGGSSRGHGEQEGGQESLEMEISYWVIERGREVRKFWE